MIDFSSIPVDKIQVITILGVMTFLEIIKFIIHKKNLQKKYNTQKILFIISIVLTAIPIAIIYDYHNLNEFILQLTNVYIIMQGIYNVLRNIMKLGISMNTNSDY